MTVIKIQSQLLKTSFKQIKFDQGQVDFMVDFPDTVGMSVMGDVFQQANLLYGIILGLKETYFPNKPLNQFLSESHIVFDTGERIWTLRELYDLYEGLTKVVNYYGDYLD